MVHRLLVIPASSLKGGQWYRVWEVQHSIGVIYNELLPSSWSLLFYSQRSSYHWHSVLEPISKLHRTIDIITPYTIILYIYRHTLVLIKVCLRVWAFNPLNMKPKNAGGPVATRIIGKLRLKPVDPCMDPDERHFEMLGPHPLLKRDAPAVSICFENWG